MTHAQFVGYLTWVWILLPPLIAGFVVGMLFMRSNYIRYLQWQKRLIMKQQRQIRKLYNVISGVSPLGSLRTVDEREE